jgi:predicted metal-dependent phosphoesterase TrpH
MSIGGRGIDLHTHTNYSDGSDTPTQLVEKAAQQGLGTLAITDHDTVAGVPEAQQAGVRYGVEILAGVELSVQYQEYADIHILGYLFNPQHASLWTWLERMQQRRMQRGLEILMRVNMCLTQRGQAPLARERVLERAHGALTRPHLAQELLAQGYVSTVEEAFREFLVPCDVPKAGLQPEEAFALVAQAGGVCSLAHPGVLSTDYAVLERLIVLFKAMGLVGVEAYHHAHTPEYLEFFLACARRYGLVVTAGSDYHGRPQGAQLGELGPGRPVPDQVLADLRQAHAAHRWESA